MSNYQSYGKYPGILKSVNLADVLGENDYKEIFESNQTDKSTINSVLKNKCNNNISKWDNLILKTGGYEDWAHTPSNLPLADDSIIYAPQGDMLPYKPFYSTPSNTIGATLDGTSDTPNRLFMFSNNIASLDCCPSTYSTDQGCICTTDEQRDFIMSRGLSK